MDVASALLNAKWLGADGQMADRAARVGGRLPAEICFTLILDQHLLGVSFALHLQKSNGFPNFDT